MCRFVSGFHRPDTGDVVVHDLESHSNTERALKLDLKVWREFHYLPTGHILARVEPEDKTTEEECERRIRFRWPNFKQFLTWALNETNQCRVFGGSLNLSGCDLKGITLPTEVGRSLDLSGCDLKGITLPTSVGGSLDLSGCDLKGITLPTNLQSRIVQ